MSFPSKTKRLTVEQERVCGEMEALIHGALMKLHFTSE